MRLGKRISFCSEDLWEHLERGSKKPVKNVMDTWTKQMGYPVLTVSSEKTANQTILKVAQKKFNADGSAGTYCLV